jgi:hypothetical protein
MQLKHKGEAAPYWLGLFVAIGFLLVRCVFDAVFLAIWGFPEGSYPLWRSSVWWPELVNAILLGYIPAVILIAHRGIDRDLRQLRSWLPCSDAEVNNIRATATGSSGVPGQAFKLSGLGIGAALVFIEDP